MSTVGYNYYLVPIPIPIQKHMRVCYLYYLFAFSAILSRSRCLASIRHGLSGVRWFLTYLYIQDAFLVAQSNIEY